MLNPSSGVSPKSDDEPRTRAPPPTADDGYGGERELLAMTPDDITEELTFIIVAAMSVIKCPVSCSLRSKRYPGVSTVQTGARLEASVL